MKWKKIIALALCCAVTLGLGAPGLAAESDDKALEAVTLKVKDALGLDTSLYTSFDGSSQEELLLGRRWNLNWSGDGVELRITADDNGKIYSYNRYDTVDEQPITLSGRFTLPSLPTGDDAAAYAAAQEFLGLVLEDGLETVELEDENYPSLHRTSYRYNGDILLNGEPSPIECSVTVRASDNQVTRFWRNDGSSGYTGAVPAAAVKTSEAQARRLLKSTLTMEPFYVLGEDGKTATVQYLPKWGDDYYVDNESGELVNLTELRALLWENGYRVTNKFLFESSGDAAAPEASLSGGATLTDAELEGAAKLAGAKDKAELDEAVKNAWPELGLKSYTLTGSSYSVTELPQSDEDAAAGKAKEYDVTCYLTYTLQQKESIARKTAVVDAKTGELKEVSGYRPWEEGTNLTVRRATAEKTAQQILGVYGVEDVDDLALFDVSEADPKGSNQFVFTYCQKANGYFYRDNSYTVTVDAVDGTVSGLRRSYDRDVVLVDPGKVVTVSQALDAFVAALDARYAYYEVPVSIRVAGPEIYDLLKNTNYSYVPTLKTGYTLTQPERYVSGVDAKTGEAVQAEPAQEEAPYIQYDDVAGTWVEAAATALAKYQVGFPGGSLKMGDQLTQLDLLTLLASVDGYQFDPREANTDTLDSFYSYCYTLGLVTPETRDEDKLMTRSELVHLILDMAGYRKIARLEGIFRCDFSEEILPTEEMGYAALAQGLGLVRGGSDGAYAGGRVAPRAEALMMLYNYMK